MRKFAGAGAQNLELAAVDSTCHTKSYRLGFINFIVNEQPKSVGLGKLCGESYLMLWLVGYFEADPSS